MLHHQSNEKPASGGRFPGIEPISMRIADACLFTGLSRSTLYVLIGQGKIDIVKVGRSSLVLTASLRAFLTGEQIADIPDQDDTHTASSSRPLGERPAAAPEGSNRPKRGRPRKHRPIT